VIQEARNLLKHGGKVHRRFPHRTAADVAALNALDPQAARELDKLLLAQYREEQAHRAHQTVESDLGPNALEQLHAATATRWSHGAGGGRRRPRAEPQP
jgi:hypothetical protein